MQFSTVGAHLLVIILSGEDLATDYKTKFFVFRLLWSFFTTAIAISNLRLLHNFVKITCWTDGGRSKDLLEDMVLHIRFGVGFSLAWTTTGAILGMRTPTGYTLAFLVAPLVWCKLLVMCFATDADSKPSSSRRSTAKQTMTADV
jgi:hypothetical protein